MNHTSQHLAAPSMRPSATFAGDLAAELHRFDEHLRDVRGLSTGTRHQRASIVGRLLQRKFADRPIDIARLRPEDVRRFLADQLDVRRTPSNASRLASALRSYFRYRTTCGDQVGGLTAVITNPVHWKLSSLPRALKPDEADRLSAREKEILRLVASGYTSAEVGSRLLISSMTVNTHLRNIYRKLQVRTRAQAVRFASLRGLF